MPRPRLPSRAPRLVLVAGLALFVGACQRSAPAPVVAEAPAPGRERIDVMAPGGERTLRLEVEPDGYALIDAAGWPIGRALIDTSSVRVTDRQGNTIVKVSRTDEGFTLDDGSGGVLQGREGDEGLELSHAGTRVGLLAHHALLLRDRKLVVSSSAGYVQVRAEDAPLLEVRGPVGDGAAYLAWTELSFPERLALMLFSTELL